MNSENEIVPNGLWSVKFSSNIGGYGLGMVVIQNNKILGGDLSYYYRGTIFRENESLGAVIEVHNYSNQLNSVFGSYSNYTITMAGEGDQENRHLTMHGSPDIQPGMKIDLSLVFITGGFE